MSERGDCLLYDDAGADPFVTGCLERELARTVGPVRRVKAGDLTGGDGWHPTARLLAIPGGADRPYVDALDGAGNASVRRFVERGGRVLGVCAGAYYACRRIDFVGGDFCVRSPRELALFPGTAAGSVAELAEPYRLNDLRCSAVVGVQHGGGTAGALYWGGCRFRPDADAGGFDVVATYADLPAGDDRAAVRARVGDGAVVLVGVHAEVAGDDFDVERRAYPGGGGDRWARQADALRAGEAGRRALWEAIVTSLL